LKIAGTGPEEDSLKAMVADDDKIEFLGYCSGATLWRLLREARAVVLPSEWYENAPMSVLEAYASGKPVIGARIGGIPELIREGETGLLFESGNSADLAFCLESIASKPASQIMAMGSAAREYVLNFFNKQRYLESMLSLYASLGVSSTNSAAGSMGSVAATRESARVK